MSAENFLTAWLAACGSEPMSVGELIVEARKESSQAQLLALEIQLLQPGRKRVSRTALGQTLGKMVGVVGALELHRRYRADNERWVYSVTPAGQPMPPRTRLARLGKEARKRIKAETDRRVAAELEKIEKTEARIERRAAVEIARQVFQKPSAASDVDEEPPYVSAKDAARIARHTPGYRPQSEPEPRRFTYPQTEKRQETRPIRTGVTARGIYTGTESEAHAYVYNANLAGLPCEVRRGDFGGLHIFAPCAESDAERVRLWFIRRGFSASVGSDADSTEVPTPAPVRERCAGPQSHGARWKLFD